MDNLITVHLADCTILLNLDSFFDRTVPLEKQRKLLNCIFRETQRNEENINILDSYLPRKQTEAKDAWEIASKQYQDAYISTQFRYDLTAQQKRSVDAANRKMLNEVKRCKTNFERWGKIIARYETLKTKNHYL